MRRFKTGDKVRVISREKWRAMPKDIDGDAYSTINNSFDLLFTKEMADIYCDKEITISESDSGNSDYYDGEYYWLDKWLEPIEQNEFLDLKPVEMALFRDYDYSDWHGPFEYAGSFSCKGVMRHHSYEDGVILAWNQVLKVEKRKVTKAEIAEKFGIPVDSFEVVE